MQALLSDMLCAQYTMHLAESTASIDNSQLQSECLKSLEAEINNQVKNTTLLFATTLSLKLLTITFFVIIKVK